jgi:hypothetical protein
MISHLHQNPPSWVVVPSRPAWGYQFTQGVHVVTGIASVPLVLAKLWVVYRRLFEWPPARSVGHALERALVVPLVAGTLFEVTSGLLNIVQWYPWPFFFPRVHYAVAWVVVGALLVHLAVKAPQIAQGLTRPRREPGSEVDPDRRALLVGVAGAVGAVTLLTAGQTVRPLRGISLLASRDPASGEQGVPVNRTAGAAGIRSLATDPGWRLTVLGPAESVTLSLDELLAMPQYEAVLPIACVEGWSATARWGGVRLRDVLDLAGIPHDRHLTATSLESDWLYASSPIGPSVARDPLSLLALRLNGTTLTLDHGYPVRLIAPNRPGVQQTKWLSRIEVAS